MSTVASQVTSPTIVYRWPVNSPGKGPVTREMFPFDGVIMKLNNVAQLIPNTVDCIEANAVFNSDRS